MARGTSSLTTSVERSLPAGKAAAISAWRVSPKNPAAVTNKEMFAMIKLSMQVDKAEFNQSLKKIRDGLDPNGKAEGYTDVIVVGITCDPLEIFDLFDEIKINIAGDSLVTGTRYLQGIVPENGGAVDALAARHFQRGFYSPIHDDVFRNFEEVKVLYKATKAKAAVYVHIEFCESEEYDLPDLKKMIRKEGIPIHVVDTEYQTTSLSHVRTRLQAFFESLRGGAL